VLYLYGSVAGPNGRKYLALYGRKDFDARGPELLFPAWPPSGISDGVKWVGEALPSFSRSRTIAQAAVPDSLVSFAVAEGCSAATTTQ
jgi:hypothetical protein